MSFWVPPGTVLFAASTLALVHVGGARGIFCACYLFGACLVDSYFDGAATPKDAKASAVWLARLLADLCWPFALLWATGAACWWLLTYRRRQP